MSIPPESIQVGKCYLALSGSVRRVARILPDGRVLFEWRNGAHLPRRRNRWRSDIEEISVFVSFAEREVPCNWTPDTDEAAG